jgi:nitric oxide reductase NorE protein
MTARNGTAAAHTPGQPDMWVLVMIEALTFSSYFVVYALDYRANAAQYLVWQSQLSLGLGVLNTLVLLTSSWSVSRCVALAKAGDHASALRYLWLTAGGGVLFAGLKLHEWSVEMAKGFTSRPTTSSPITIS